MDGVLSLGSMKSDVGSSLVGRWSPSSLKLGPSLVLGTPLLQGYRERVLRQLGLSNVDPATARINPPCPALAGTTKSMSCFSKDG